MEINDSIRKSVEKRLSKVFNKKISKKIENSIFDFSEQYSEIQGTPFLIEQIYEDKVEEILCHFESNSNTDLINNIKKNIIDPSNVAHLKPQELNPDKYEKITKKKEIEEFNKNNQASTDFFQCKKCKKRKCKIEEKQTRAGDEPATTFVECLECGNKWRIG